MSKPLRLPRIQSYKAPPPSNREISLMLQNNVYVFTSTVGTQTDSDVFYVNGKPARAVHPFRIVPKKPKPDVVGQASAELAAQVGEPAQGPSTSTTPPWAAASVAAAAAAAAEAAAAAAAAAAVMAEAAEEVAAAPEEQVDTEWVQPPPENTQTELEAAQQAEPEAAVEEAGAEDEAAADEAWQERGSQLQSQQTQTDLLQLQIVILDNEAAAAAAAAVVDTNGD